ncbi:MAG: site-2 protease family protein [Proteobacteria bacterium]|nr:site-2 protease family protein [Pseudomonadota bacterium]
MKWSYKIADIAGIKIQVHFTFLIIIAWFSLAYWQLEGTLSAVFEGVTFILALFFCVLLHELGHAFTAAGFGIRTRSITLLPIGGVALIEKNPDDPRQEILIALAGPAVSFSIATLLWLVLTVTGRLVPIEELGVAGGPFLQRLMIVNYLIAMFNLIPAFPMDGGRVFRAFLSLGMEATRATRLAAGLGQLIAIMFAVLGLMYNPFLFFIAIFIWFGAAAEVSVATIKHALLDVLAAQAMLTNFQTLKPGDTLAKAIELTLSGSQKDFPVMEGNKVIGMLAQSDLLRGLKQGGDQLEVARVMLNEIIDVHPQDRMGQILDMMQGKPQGLVTVSESGQLKGIINFDNVFELLRIQAAIEGSHSASSQLRI